MSSNQTPIVLSPDYWRKCSSCKKDIGYGATYYECSVSTCTRKRTGYVFCTVHCWERHLPGARHRDAAAIEVKAPTFAEWKAELENEPNVSTAAPSSTAAAVSATAPQRVFVKSQSGAPAPRPQGDPLEKEILIVASKLKMYIKARSEMNTSDGVMDALSSKVRRLCDDAIDKARQAGRKTVMDRDFD